MAILLSCESLSKSYDTRPLFRDISFGLSDREQVGLIGPNGAGKSTLLKILAGAEKPSSGVVSLRRGSRLGYIPQVDALPLQMTVEEALLEALQQSKAEDYEKALQIEIVMSKVGFSRRDQKIEELSGGWRKRTAIARELVKEPDLLLIDEPTNHLDLEGILWLEKFLRAAPFGYLLVSHDRYFLENVTNRVVELNRAYPDGYFSVSGAYSEFLIKREEFLAAQAHQEVALASRVRREIEWLQRGARARTTKSVARIQEAGRMIGDLSDLKERNAEGKRVTIDFGATGRRSKKLLAVKGIEKSLGGKLLFRNLSFTLSPGARLGILGANGSGKTTLLRVLGSELEPDRGAVEWADGLQIVRFDQNREQLDLDVPLRTALAGKRDTVQYRGSDVHVSSWAKRFLFKPEQLNVPVSELSGGEQARILIARLMLLPADILILDEPTNDLDIPSLEVLEESLVDFPGALILVTHDRYMLDRVSTEILSLDGSGEARFFADYAQWETVQAAAGEGAAGGSRDVSSGKSVPGKGASAAGTTPVSAPAPPRGAVLTFKEQRELNGIEAKIMAAEVEMQSHIEAMTDPAVASDHVRLRQVSEAVHAAQEKVERLYRRWEELEARRVQSAGE